MALCSVSDKLVLNESKSPSTPPTPNLPASLMPIEDDEVPASPGSANSSDFSYRVLEIFQNCIYQKKIIIFKNF